MLPLVLAQVAETGDGAATPQVVVALSTVAALLVGFGLLVLLSRRMRIRTSSARRPVTARWVRTSRAIVDLVLVVYALGAIAAVVGLAAGSDSITSGGDRLRLGAHRIEMVVDATTFGDYGGADAAKVRLLERRAHEGWYGAGARAVRDQQYEVVAEDPAFLLWAGALATWAVGLLAVGIGLVALRTVLQLAEAETPFEARAVSALRWMALALGGGALLVNVGTWAVAREVVRRGGGEQWVPFDVPLPYLLAAAGVLALSEVWRYGIGLQDDAEATI